MVPVDGFWSITVYGADGYLHKNDQDSYSINDVTAKKDADGTVTIQFGGCDGAVINCIPVTPGLELHGASLSATKRDSRRHLEVPKGAAAMIHFKKK